MDGLCPRCVALDFLTPTDFDAGAEPLPFGKLPPAAERRVGDYELLEELGRGGMGVVYRARQLSLGREVAVKFLLHGALAGDQAMARFRAEAEAVANLQHPHIVAIYEIGEDRGRHFQAMELVAGRSLAEVLRGGPLPAIRAAGYLRSVAEALHYAHEQGVLHRDLKPANVLIDQRDEPRVTDFGLAKRLSDAPGGTPLPELTLSGQVLGTPAYIPPEQAAGGAVDARSDVYSLGALLYHLIVGRPPFVGESATQVLRLVAETEPIAPSLLNPSLPRDLETISLKCLEKEPARRYGTAHALANDLGRFLRDEPILARPISLLERAWRWCKRTPALAASMVGIALLLVGIAVMSNQSARRIEGLRLNALTNLYASDMRLVQQAIAESKFGAATELLDRHLPKAGDPDLRGFEWRHFQERCLSDEAAALEPHSNQVARAAFSPDGRLFATGAIDVKVWESATRRLIFRLPIKNYVWALAFSPDGKELLVGDGGNSVYRYDIGEPTTLAGAKVSAGRLLGALNNLDARPIAFFWPTTEPGIRIVLHDGLMAWDGASHEAARIATFDTAFTRLQVSSDGSLAVALHGPNQIAVWRLNPPSRLREFKQTALSRAVAISSDGERIAAGDFSGVLRIFELKPDGGTNAISAHRGLIEAMAFSPDNLRLGACRT